MAHESVLLHETIDGLALAEGDIYLDATLGLGGHLEQASHSKGVTLLGIDADDVSLSIARERLALAGVRPKLAVLNFRNIDRVLEIFEIADVSKILFDLGWNSEQLGFGRGFSFNEDEPLQMTFRSSVSEEETTAYDVVNHWEENNLADVIYGYGEERYSRRIAKAIVERRKAGPIKTSKELALIIKNAVPFVYRFGRIHPATRTFQAIRIAVNDELHALETGLGKSWQILRKGGRIAVISFHSLEDRIVKNFFKSKCEINEGELINKKPIIPTDNEISKNPRSRSAKLRLIQKIK